MKKVKLTIFIFLFVIMGLLLNTAIFTKAETNNESLIKVLGAQIRTKGTQGIRFVGTVEDTFDTTGVSRYGVAIAFGEANLTDITVGGTVNGKEVLNAEVTNYNEDRYFYISLINIPEESYGQKVTARAYVVRNDKYEYADTKTTRSLGEVALKMQIDYPEFTCENLTSVMETLETSYMKTYKVGDYVYVNDALYEYEPTELAKYFIKDFNEVTGESITTMNGFGMAYRGTNGTSGTDNAEAITSNKLYKFYSNETMKAKWGWVLEYVEEHTSTTNSRQSYVGKQADYINGTTTLTDSNADWWGARHLLGGFEGFFTRSSVITGFTSNEFADPSVYNDLADYMKDNNIQFDKTIECDLVEVGKDMSFPNVDIISGYSFDGYELNDQLYNDTYTVTSSNVVFVGKYSVNNYSIKFYNSNSELSDLTSYYTVEDEVTLPELELDGYNFLGWYETSDFSDDVVTKIAKGTIGDKMYYAKLEVTEYVNVNVTYDTNGGSFNVNQISSVNSFDVINYDNYDDTENTYMTDNTPLTLTYQYKIILNYNSSLGLYEVVAVNKANDSITNIVTNGGLSWSNAIVNAKVDITGNAIVGQYISIDFDSLKTGNAQIAKVYDLTNLQGFTTILKEPCDLLIPTRDGYVFNGWLSSVDSSVITSYPGYGSNPGDITYTAQWKSSSEGVYTITYMDEEGNILTGLTPTSYSIETSGSIDLPDGPAKEGYEFLGWYDGDERLATFFASDAEDKVFVAKYQAIESDAKYSIPSDMTYMITEVNVVKHSTTGLDVYQPKLPSGAPSGSSNYTWTSLNTEVLTISEFSTMSPVSSGYAIIRGEYKTDSSIVLYGVMKVIGGVITASSIEEANTPVYYTVTFTDESGNVVDTQSVKEGEAAVLPTPPTKEGYTFYGWSANHYPITEDITLEPTYIAGESDFIGKKVSILGDSISTYKGYIPDGYKYFYPDPSSQLSGVNDTWWMKVVNKLGMNLLKNNSWAGSCVSEGTGNGATVNDSRLIELLDGETTPDIILLFMGSNDCGSEYVKLSTFTTSYKTMLDKILVLCPNAEIYIMTLPPSKLYTESDRILYNEVIVNYAEQYNLPLIDMDNVYGGANVSNYLVDSAHLNLAGMEKFSETVVANLLKYAGITQ